MQLCPSRNFTTLIILITMTINSLKRNFLLLIFLLGYTSLYWQHKMPPWHERLTYKPAGTCVEIVLNLVDWSCGGGGRLILWQNWFWPKLQRSKLKIETRDVWWTRHFYCHSRNLRESDQQHIGAKRNFWCTYTQTAFSSFSVYISFSM